MQNNIRTTSGHTRPDVTVDVTRGVVRHFIDLGLSPVTEFTLPNGRRADVVGLDAKGLITAAEVKSCQADFDADQKWHDYMPFCDRFYFAVAESFPTAVLPEETGLIIADSFGAATVRPAQDKPLAPARRKALTLRFARHAAMRALTPAISATVRVV